MSNTAVITVVAPQPTVLDDEIAAWNLQLEEAGIHGQGGKGKYPAGSPPDSTIAFDHFHSEIEAHLSFLRDVKLAHSITLVINMDADAIAELAAPGEQAQDDRDFAMQLNGFINDDDDLNEARPSASYCTAAPRWLTTTAASTRVIDEPEHTDNNSIEAPHTYTGRQANAFEKLSQEFDCSVCFETFHAPSVVSLDCGDRYCLGCLKDTFVRATRDETLFPPRCCRQPIAVTVVSHELTRAQLNAFKLVEMEFSTGDSTYCSNLNCASFIPLPDVMADKAFCTQCGSKTCAICKGEFHQDTDCPYDHALHGSLALGDQENWQRYYSCRQLVELDHGCNHIT
jgi:hypothetical protein